MAIRSFFMVVFISDHFSYFLLGSLKVCNPFIFRVAILMFTLFLIPFLGLDGAFGLRVLHLCWLARPGALVVPLWLCVWLMPWGCAWCVPDSPMYLSLPIVLGSYGVVILGSCVHVCIRRCVMCPKCQCKYITAIICVQPKRDGICSRLAQH